MKERSEFKSMAEFAAEGLRGKALSDALYEQMLGAPPPAEGRTKEEMMRSREEFFAIMATLTPEELAEDIFAGRPTNVSILDDECVLDAHSA